MKRRMSFLWGLLLIPLAGTGQSLTLERCEELAQRNYPLIRQYGLIAASRQYDLSNASKGYLPQLALSGKASYQSEVTELPFDIPNVDMKMRKDQYQVALEATQSLWDGGNIRARRQGIEAQAQADSRQTDVGMYALRERVNQIFFGILLLDASLEQNRLLAEELQRSYDQVAACVENGVSKSSDLDAVRVSQLDALQKRKELEASRAAYTGMLSHFIGQMVSENTPLEMPGMPQVSPGEVRRPELGLYAAMDRQLDVRRKSVNAAGMPRINAFVQGAYGNPGLNMLKNEFSGYYVAGVRLNWNFGSLYTRKGDMRLIEVQKDNIETQRRTFLFNTSLETTQQRQEVEKYGALLRDDARITALRENLVNAARAQVAGGTLSVYEMLRQITDLDLARQGEALHRIQMLQAAYTLKNTVNN